MKFNLKESFETLAKNPHITLLLVTYFLIIAGLLPLMAIQTEKLRFFLIMFLLLLLTGAFLAGWFGMIKCVVSYKEKGDMEEDLKNRYESFRNGFFSSIPLYMLPVIFYIILLFIFGKGLLYAADYIFGDPSEFLAQAVLFSGDKDALMNFLATIPKETMASIAERSIFVYTSFLFYLLITFYSIPSLFFNCTRNPLTGIKKGIIALLKKPLGTISLFLSIILSHIAIVFLEAISTVNQILMFFALVLRVCFIAYVVVLIFSVYEKNFACDSNNGSDRLGEDSSCN